MSKFIISYAYLSMTLKMACRKLIFKCGWSTKLKGKIHISGFLLELGYLFKKREKICTAARSNHILPEHIFKSRVFFFSNQLLPNFATRNTIRILIILPAKGCFLLNLTNYRACVFFRKCVLLSNKLNLVEHKVTLMGHSLGIKLSAQTNWSLGQAC